MNSNYWKRFIEIINVLAALAGIITLIIFLLEKNDVKEAEKKTNTADSLYILLEKRVQLLAMTQELEAKQKKLLEDYEKSFTQKIENNQGKQDNGGKSTNYNSNEFNYLLTQNIDEIRDSLISMVDIQNILLREISPLEQQINELAIEIGDKEFYKKEAEKNADFISKLLSILRKTFHEFGNDLDRIGNANTTSIVENKSTQYLVNQPEKYIAFADEVTGKYYETVNAENKVMENKNAANIRAASFEENKGSYPNLDKVVKLEYWVHPSVSERNISFKFFPLQNQCAVNYFSEKVFGQRKVAQTGYDFNEKQCVFFSYHFNKDEFGEYIVFKARHPVCGIQNFNARFLISPDGANCQVIIYNVNGSSYT